jgi:hypothetical protein
LSGYFDVNFDFIAERGARLASIPSSLCAE